ncbi:MAG: hypothetical protein ABW133_19580 [Polyangiaceae bacterium]
MTNVDDLFEPTSTGTAGKGGTGGATGGSGGVGGGVGGGATGGSGGTGGMAGTAGAAGTGGTGGTGGATGGTGGTTGGTGGVAGTGGTGGIVDAGGDVRRDATTDVRDAGKAGNVKCGVTNCDPSLSFCCLQSGNNRCLVTGSTGCAASVDKVRCDDTSDCPTGQICCVTAGTGGNGAEAACALATACTQPKQMLCDPATITPCLNLANVVCSANGSGHLEDYPYCHAP